jgi:hypothetical protein
MKLESAKTLLLKIRQALISRLVFLMPPLYFTPIPVDVNGRGFFLLKIQI